MSISQNYPNVSPQLLIDLANTQKLDPRIAFARASTGTYYDANGVLQTATDNVARFQFNPVTGESEGLLRENQATNLVAPSNWGSGWDKSFYAVTPVFDLVGVDGVANSAFSAKPSDAGGSNRVEYTTSGVTVATSTNHVFSVYLKKLQSPFANLSLYQFTTPGNFKRAYFDLENGVLGTVDAAYDFADITSAGNGWFRCVIGFTTDASDTTGLCIIGAASANNDTYVPLDGVSKIGIFGAQLEEGSFPTSYIPTSASQVTRAADVATLANVDAYNTDEFTAVTKPFGVSGVASNLVTLNGDAPIERLYVYPRNISQDQINTLVENDGWWNWRIVGADFALPLFVTDGTVEVDWGDGTVETLTTALHTFTNASPHTVRFKLTSGTYFRPRIDNNAMHKDKVVALGSAPSNMIVDCFDGFFGCNNLKSFDATLIGGTNFTAAWQSCTSLTSFPLIDTSSGTSFNFTWSGCNSLTSFPLIDTSAGTSFSDTWNGCNSLTSFPLLDMSLAENLNECWDTCSSLTSFPAIDFPACTNFTQAWINCNSLTSFPLINTSSGTDFEAAWYNCSSLTDFPANFFDSWVGVPVANCFLNTWDGCSALTTTSVENILVSIDTSAVSAPATGTEITIDYNVATGALTTPTTNAITSLKAKNWTININGVLQ